MIFLRTFITIITIYYHYENYAIFTCNVTHYIHCPAVRSLLRIVIFPVNVSPNDFIIQVNQRQTETLNVAHSAIINYWHFIDCIITTKGLNIWVTYTAYCQWSAARLTNTNQLPVTNSNYNCPDKQNTSLRVTTTFLHAVATNYDFQFTIFKSM